ncbi:MAG TPA: hypothetical protein VLX90_16585, partial [Steroidobacteraceae bacterium]|nr:hypothetical protein [Steroidobacteraceae bacterium]
MLQKAPGALVTSFAERWTNQSYQGAHSLDARPDPVYRVVRQGLDRRVGEQTDAGVYTPYQIGLDRAMQSLIGTESAHEDRIRSWSVHLGRARNADSLRTLVLHDQWVMQMICPWPGQEGRRLAIALPGQLRIA